MISSVNMILHSYTKDAVHLKQQKRFNTYINTNKHNWWVKTRLLKYTEYRKAEIRHLESTIKNLYSNRYDLGFNEFRKVRLYRYKEII